MHIDQKSHKTKEYDLGSDDYKIVMIAPDKVVVPQYYSKEILIINLATAEENRIPFEYQSK